MSISLFICLISSSNSLQLSLISWSSFWSSSWLSFEICASLSAWNLFLDIDEFLGFLYSDIYFNNFLPFLPSHFLMLLSAGLENLAKLFVIFLCLKQFFRFRFDLVLDPLVVIDLFTVMEVEQESWEALDADFGMPYEHLALGFWLLTLAQRGFWVSWFLVSNFS